MPKISIIVPVYKVERYLLKCLDSILAQTFEDWECLLVDDGSPDGSGRICDEYAAKDARFKVIHKQNEGVGAARNTGLEHASGQYVAFVDSDDFCENTYLENFNAGDGTEADIVIQGYQKYIDGVCPGVTFKASSYTRNELVGGIIENDLLTFGAPYCKLFRRDIIERDHIRFATKYSFGEDMYFFFYYLTHLYSIELVDGAGYYYRCEQNDSLSVKDHDFADLVMFANDSLCLLRQIDNKQHQLEIAYSYSYVGLHARAIANMYRLGYSWSKRQECINSLKKNKMKVLLFKGKNSYKISYLVAKKFPSFIVNIIFLLLHKLKIKELGMFPFMKIKLNNIRQ